MERSRELLALKTRDCSVSTKSGLDRTGIYSLELTVVRHMRKYVMRAKKTLCGITPSTYITNAKLSEGGQKFTWKCGKLTVKAATLLQVTDWASYPSPLVNIK